MRIARTRNYKRNQKINRFLFAFDEKKKLFFKWRDNRMKIKSLRSRHDHFIPVRWKRRNQIHTHSQTHWLIRRMAIEIAGADNKRMTRSWVATSFLPLPFWLSHRPFLFASINDRFDFLPGRNMKRVKRSFRASFSLVVESNVAKFANETSQKRRSRQKK